MTRRPLSAVPALLLLVAGFFLAGAGPAAAHEERPATFPDGSGERPTYLGLDNPRHRVVCTDRSAALIADIKNGALRQRNQELLEDCEFRSIQTAVNSIKKPRTSIYILPGRYTESKWANQERSE